jgi:DNA-binding NarL/FixJ family response regulator
MRPDMPIRVAVVSRNHVVRTGLVNLVAQLEQRALVSEAAEVDDVLAPHDVAIYDLGANVGQAAYADLQRLLDEGIQVIGLVYDTDRETLAAPSGATFHVITLSVTPEQLLEVLRATTPARPGGSSTAGTNSLPADLTEQEFRTLELIGAGLTNEELAKELYVSINTVKSYVRTAYKKIGVTDRSNAMLWAVKHGLAGGPDRR